MTKQEMEQGFQKVWDLFAATDRELKELFRETDRRFKETDRRFQETDRQFKETDRKLQQTDKKIDALTGKWGRFVEGLVLPAAKKIFRDRGILIEKVSPRMNAQKNGDALEIDVLGVGENYAVMIEVKSTLSVDDVKEHLRDLSRFKTFFPEYADRKLLGAVAGIVIEEHVSRYAYQQGLFVIAQSGDAVQIINDAKFRPKEW